jgi:hypothetical protein
VVVAVTAHGSNTAFSYTQKCGSDVTEFSLTDGQSHVTKNVPAGTVCTVTQTGGPPGAVDVSVTGSGHASSVQNAPPRGVGSVPSEGTLEFLFAAPTGGVNVGQVSPPAVPNVIVLPGKAAGAVLPGAGSGRAPLVAGTASPSVSPDSSPTDVTLDSQTSALAAPPSPGVRPAALGGACVLGLGLLALAALGGRAALRRGN